MLTYTIPPNIELAARLQAAAVQLNLAPAALATGMLYSCLSSYDELPLEAAMVQPLLVVTPPAHDDRSQSNVNAKTTNHDPKGESHE